MKMHREGVASRVMHYLARVSPVIRVMSDFPSINDIIKTGHLRGSRLRQRLLQRYQATNAPQGRRMKRRFNIKCNRLAIMKKNKQLMLPPLLGLVY